MCGEKPPQYSSIPKSDGSTIVGSSIRGTRKVNKRQDGPDLIISVESRKGGVGKTTAALCLASLLRRRGYSVLVLDMDVTGTDAADIASSPFWVNDLHVIREPNEQDVGDRPANLIKLFDQYFMAGRMIPEFSTQKSQTAPKRILLDQSKVNVLGSQIYRIHPEDKNTRSTTSIEQPGILFDDLHAIWLLEFVKQVADNFARSIRGAQSRRSAVIIDNSPGYVGIGPVIHEWLTDCGPERGKFLIVTSLDTQDLNACDRAIDSLHNLYVGKWETSRLFVDAGNEGGSIEVPKDREAFFIRLASAAGNTGVISDPLAFYRETHPTSLQQVGGVGQRFCDDPLQYIAVVLNRVPRAVKTGRLTYEYQPSFSNNRDILGRLLSGDTEKQDWRGRMISYDEYIENQFLLQSLMRGRGRYEHRVHRLLELLDMAERQLQGGPDDDIEQIRWWGLAGEHYEQVRKQLDKANSIISRTRAAIDDAGLGHLTRLVHDEWLPGSIVPDFRSWILRLFREGDFPYMEMLPFEFGKMPDDADTHEFVEMLRHRILMEVQHSELASLTDADYHMIDILTGVLSMLAGLSFASPLWHSPFEKEMCGFLAGIVAIETKHWMSKEQTGKSSIQRFLAQESITQSELHKMWEGSDSFRFLRHTVMRHYDTSFADFYRACTSAQARLIDFQADSRFLLQLFRFIVKGEMERGNLFPFVRAISEDVIVKKVLTHEDAPARMAKALQTAQYFGEFDKVLSDVLKTWGMVREHS